VRLINDGEANTQNASVVERSPRDERRGESWGRGFSLSSEVVAALAFRAAGEMHQVQRSVKVHAAVY